MAQIGITLAPTLAVELVLTGVGTSAPVTVVRPEPVVSTALYEMLRGPKGDPGEIADLATDPLAYYILAKA